MAFGVDVRAFGIDSPDEALMLIDLGCTHAHAGRPACHRAGGDSRLTAVRPEAYVVSSTYAA